jgi:L-asparaginase
MCKILFVQAGGMIDMNNSVPAFQRFVEERLSPSFEYEFFSIFQKDGNDITDDDRVELLEQIDDLLEIAYGEGNEYDGVIITHGTEGMVETARFLGSTEFDEDRSAPRILITGAMRSERDADSDADGNLGMAIAAVQTTPPGFVGICMHGLVLSHDTVDRDPYTGKIFRKCTRRRNSSMGRISRKVGFMSCQPANGSHQLMSAC